MRKAKLESTLKLTYDTFFYLFTAGTAFVLFRDQSWFPGWVGGKGSCQNIYREFPDIPQDKRVEMELFYAFQLGVHIFSVFEMVVIKRKTAQKYYEMLLHHMLAASLIVFSAMSNEITVGIMILFTHDISDVFLAFCRSYVETKLSKVQPPRLRARLSSSSPSSTCSAGGSICASWCSPSASSGRQSC